MLEQVETLRLRILRGSIVPLNEKIHACINPTPILRPALEFFPHQAENNWGHRFGGVGCNAAVAPVIEVPPNEEA